MTEDLQHGDSVNCLLIDGRRIYSAGGDGLVREWDRVSSKCVRELANCEGAPISALALVLLKRRTSARRMLCTASYDHLVGLVGCTFVARGGCSACRP